MSSNDHEEKPEGISRYLERMKSVLRSRSTRRQSLAADVTTAESSYDISFPNSVYILESPLTLSWYSVSVSNPPATATPKAKAPAPAQEPSIPQPVMIADYSTTQHEKARTLFAKYGLALNQADLKPHSDLQLIRVTKPIRMRVHRTCHRCETTFGAEKLCINCQHTRCTKCPRHPLAKIESSRKPKLPEPSIPQSHSLFKEQHLGLGRKLDQPLKIPSPPSGQNYVQKPMRQRVHRYCHFCTMAFAPGSNECSDCNHTRCKICPRDPAKLDKHPNGYPGDAEPPKTRPNRTFRKTRRRVHYECHVCATRYQGPSGICSKCGQVKGTESIRIPPKKIKPEPNPETVRIIEEKLASLLISRAETAKSVVKAGA
ncbi:hypothetical protein N7457_004664 [Penicillium paradoxum]|uniref:uncharacterized protein n=1 Tax=Penicillium paradoxum TaxID=176176 RepID=UPI0025475EC0|nr:uncharacterized protein N7457_004664 [Penicillium paradoxum]KAJ5782890.1 hypothetical protein N7457_004664 [Penicillium paradoxum]